MLSDPDYGSPFEAMQEIRLINRYLDRLEQDKVTRVDIETIDKVFHPEPLRNDDKLAKVLADRGSELVQLDRYERRALSRRKISIRNFDAVNSMAADGSVKDRGVVQQTPRYASARLLAEVGARRQEHAR